MTDTMIYDGPGYPAYVEGFSRRERRRLGIQEGQWCWYGPVHQRYLAYRIRLEKTFLFLGRITATVYVDGGLLLHLSTDEVCMEAIARECTGVMAVAYSHRFSAGARD